MKEEHKPASKREQDLRLAMHRIQKGRSHLDEKKLSISAVAREAGVSTALIHNHYPKIAEAIRLAQGRDSRFQRDKKHEELKMINEKNKELRAENKVLLGKISSLASINEVLISDNQTLLAKLNSPKVRVLNGLKKVTTR
ncbi:MAG: TetR family transcriptional regulator [Pseudomonadota bacterium]